MCKWTIRTILSQVYWVVVYFKFWELFLFCFFSGESCISPGNIPHGQWTCSTQELPIPDATFLDGGAKTYKGEFADNAIIVISIIC